MNKQTKTHSQKTPLPYNFVAEGPLFQRWLFYEKPRSEDTKLHFHRLDESFRRIQLISAFKLSAINTIIM